MQKKNHTDAELQELRTGGIIKQKQKDYFILRTRIPGGYLKADILKKYSVIAKKYGRDYVHISTRQGIEIPWIHINNIPKLLNDLKNLGILRGACGPRSRNLIACPGASVCRFGLVNTEELARKLDRVVFGKEVPKKFKVAISGCLNSCSKPQENDLGFLAQGEPEVDLSKCIGCTLCAKVCEKVCGRGKREPAIIMDENKRPVYRKENCFFEGDCVRVCPVNAWKVKKTGFAVYIGGRVGRFPKFGIKIANFVDEKQIPRIIKNAISCYNRIAQTQERFGEALEKQDIETIKKEIL
ncbi:MAG: nitrite reductase [Candidatus Omnitrophica bacterium]|nr:nitrite reductase [Candidatus Omnitrophota bacterium]